MAEDNEQIQGHDELGGGFPEVLKGVSLAWPFMIVMKILFLFVVIMNLLRLVKSLIENDTNKAATAAGGIGLAHLLLGMFTR
jgi:F0F1-type ATP synthase membrane subunit a